MGADSNDDRVLLYGNHEPFFLASIADGCAKKWFCFDNPLG